MVRSMIAGVAGLKAHQSKMDVIGNNIANVNTWGFKGFSYNFMDSMYTNSIKSTGGSVERGASGGRNASQVGYGSQLSSISNVFESGAPSPSANPMDCMIDGTGFFLVGTMVNGAFTDIKSSGLYLSRVGIFRVDDNSYLVDDQRSYVYGYALKEGTGIPEEPSQRTVRIVNGADWKYTERVPADPANNVDEKSATITIAGITVNTNMKDINDLKTGVDEWMEAVLKREEFKDFDIGYVNTTRVKDDAGNERNALIFRIESMKAGADAADGSSTPVKDTQAMANRFLSNQDSAGTNNSSGGPVGTIELTQDGTDYVAGIPAEFEEQLSTLRIPLDVNGQRYKLDSYSILEDGTVVGVDEQNRIITIGQVALIQVQNPNGLEKTTGYYYTIGDNAGDVSDVKPGTGPAGIIKGSYLEMANVDLANEFSNIITTQRGFQANSKIITVTDEMLQELVNMKR